MQQSKIVNRILKLIEEKQKNEEYGYITIKFQKGFINRIQSGDDVKVTEEEECTKD